MRLPTSPVAKLVLTIFAAASLFLLLDGGAPTAAPTAA